MLQLDESAFPHRQDPNRQCRFCFADYFGSDTLRGGGVGGGGGGGGGGGWLVAEGIVLGQSVCPRT